MFNFIDKIQDADKMKTNKPTTNRLLDMMIVLEKTIDKH